MARCEICLRSGMYGNNVSHSKKRTRTRALVNVQRSKIYEKDVLRQVNICTKCLRTQSKSSSKA